MVGENITDWSTTAASNATADSSINFQEGQARASLNDSMRSVMAAIAKDRNLKNGSITTGGSANAQTVSSGMAFGTVPSFLRILVKNGFTNTASMTLQLDTAPAALVKNTLGGALLGSEVKLNGYSEYLYDGSNWILLENDQRKWTIAVITATNLTWPVPAGTKEMQLEVWGAGAAGLGSSAGYSGAGGGAGAYAFKYFTGPIMDVTLAVTIGSAGAAQPPSGGGGGGGTTTVVGANLGTISCGGGVATGVAGAGAGGTGGAASGGDINITGGQGMGSHIFNGNEGSVGGDAPRGGGGGKTNVAAAGQIPGGGGSGANYAAGNSGAGARGQVVIWTR